MWGKNISWLSTISTGLVLCDTRWWWWWWWYWWWWWSSWWSWWWSLSSWSSWSSSSSSSSLPSSSSSSSSSLSELSSLWLLSDLFSLGYPTATCTMTHWVHTFNSICIIHCRFIMLLCLQSYTYEGCTGLIPGLRAANERRRYKVTHWTSLIGWAQT